MRQIKFRGLRVDGKGWVYSETIDQQKGGSVYLKIYPKGGPFMAMVEVRPETVGQFITNLYGDTPVYHGDILQMKCDVGGVRPKYVIDNDGIDWVLKFYGRPDGMNGQRWGKLSRLQDLGIMKHFGKLMVIRNIHEQ
jgi:hypothetical protein